MDEEQMKIIAEALLGGILTGQKKLVIESRALAFGKQVPFDEPYMTIEHTIKVIDCDG